MRDKIRLVSTAGTGFFYTTDKNKLRRWKSKSLIQRFVNMFFLKKLKLSNFSFLLECKNPAYAGFFVFDLRKIIA